MTKTVRRSEEDLKERIFQAAQARFERYGYRKTTMDEIAHDAGIAKGTTYLYFKSKDEIVAAYADRELEKMYGDLCAVARSRGGAAERLERLLVGRALWIIEHGVRTPEGHEIIFEVGGHVWREVFWRHIQRQIELIGDVVEEGCRCGELAPAVDPRRAAHAASAAFSGVIRQPPPGVPITREQREALVHDIARLVVAGMRAGRPLQP